MALPFRRPKTRAGIDLGKLKERIDSLPDMDAARLVELHNRLETKSLELDAHEIADKMLDLERWLESILGKEG